MEEKIYPEIEEFIDDSHYLFDQLTERQQMRVALKFLCGWPTKGVAEYEGVCCRAIEKDFQGIISMIRRKKLLGHVRAVTGLTEFLKTPVR